MKVYKSDQ